MLNIALLVSAFFFHSVPSTTSVWTIAIPQTGPWYFSPTSNICNCNGSNPTTSIPVPDDPSWTYTGDCQADGYCDGSIEFGPFPGSNPQSVTIPQGMCIDRADFTIVSSWIPPLGVSTWPRLCTDGCEAGTYYGDRWDITPHFVACPTGTGGETGN